MIVAERSSWLKTLFVTPGKPPIAKLWRRVAVVTAISSIVTVLHETHGLFHSNLTVTPFTLIGFALSVFFGFRHNSSYDRFWEGRKLWGALVNVSRSNTRAALTWIDLERGGRDGVDARRRELVLLFAAFPHMLRQHLRDAPSNDDVRGLVADPLFVRLEGARHRPLVLLDAMSERLAAFYREGHVDRYHVPMFEAGIAQLTDILGACERIRNTPIPYSYTALLHRIVALYCVLLPFGLVSSIELFTPAVVMVVSYTFFGLDMVGDEVENPFGLDANDLPLGALSRNIEIDLRSQLGDRDLPSPLRPIDDVLL